MEYLDMAPSLLDVDVLLESLTSGDFVNHGSFATCVEFHTLFRI